MMRALDAGGLSVMTDDHRPATEDNPNGYYEYEPVKSLADQNNWLDQACGKTIKIVSPILRHLPSHLSHRIVFLLRDIQEILASQKSMLTRRGHGLEDQPPDDVMAAYFEKHLSQVTSWLAAQENINVFYIGYRDVVFSPRDAMVSVNNFLGGQLDVEKMVASVDSKLYRQRAG